MPLTDVAIRKAKPTDSPVRMFDGGGLYIEVYPNEPIKTEARFTRAFSNGPPPNRTCDFRRIRLSSVPRWRR